MVTGIILCAGDSELSVEKGGEGRYASTESLLSALDWGSDVTTANILTMLTSPKCLKL